MYVMPAAFDYVMEAEGETGLRTGSPIIRPYNDSVFESFSASAVVEAEVVEVEEEEEDLAAADEDLAATADGEDSSRQGSAKTSTP